MDVIEAVDGDLDPYQCREIRQQGRGALAPEECTEPCILAQTMRAAHESWRASLAAVTVADIIGTLPPQIYEHTPATVTYPRRRVKAPSDIDVHQRW